MPHVEFCLFNRARQIAFAPQIVDDATVTVRSERVGVRRHTLVEQAPHFINQAIGEVRLSSRIDSGVEFPARRVQRENLNAVPRLGTVKVAVLGSELSLIYPRGRHFRRPKLGR